MQRASLRAFQDALEDFNTCWQETAVDLGLPFNENDEYEYIVVESLSENRLGETVHGDTTEIRLSLSQIKAHAIAERLNFWHLFAQTAIHEWIHVEQRRILESRNQWWLYKLAWFRVELERQAQRMAYEWYLRIYNRAPPQSYHELPSGDEWDKNKARYNELFSKKTRGEELTEAELTELDELNRRFDELQSEWAPSNHPAYTFNHFDLCG